MYLSTNQGLTWTLEDAAGEPSNTTGAACSYDGANTVWVAWGGPPSEGGLFLYVAAFDTATNTWGTPFRNELVDVGKMLSVCFRSDGTLFMGYLSPDTSSGLAYSIFDTIGSTFTALSVELAPGILTLPEYSANVDVETMVLAGDAIPATTIYYAYQTSDVSVTPQMQNGIFFSTFTAGDAITNFFTVPGQIGTPSQPSPQAFEAQGPPFMGPPAVCGAGNVVIPMAQLSAAGGTTRACTYRLTAESVGRSTPRPPALIRASRQAQPRAAGRRQAHSGAARSCIAFTRSGMAASRRH